MAYDEGLAHRLGESLGDLPDLSTRKMFGSLVFLWRGNMLVGALGSDLIARVGPEAVAEDGALEDWIARCREFVEALPPK